MCLNSCRRHPPTSKRHYLQCRLSPIVVASMSMLPRIFLLLHGLHNENALDFQIYSYMSSRPSLGWSWTAFKGLLTPISRESTKHRREVLYAKWEHLFEGGCLWKEFEDIKIDQILCFCIQICLLYTSPSPRD